MLQVRRALCMKVHFGIFAFLHFFCEVKFLAGCLGLFQHVLCLAGVLWSFGVRFVSGHAARSAVQLWQKIEQVCETSW